VDKFDGAVRNIRTIIFYNKNDSAPWKMTAIDALQVCVGGITGALFIAFFWVLIFNWGEL